MTRRIAPFLLLAGLACAGPAFARTPNGWVGRNVFLKSPTATLKVGPVVVGDGRSFRKYEVERVEGAWLWLVSDEVAGWALWTDVVVTEQADDYFSGLIRERPSAWAYSMRGQLRSPDLQLQAGTAKSRSTEPGKGWGVSWTLGKPEGGEKSGLARPLADLDEAIRLDPGAYDPYIARAEIRFLMGDRDRAFGDLDQAEPAHARPSRRSRRCARSSTWNWGRRTRRWPTPKRRSGSPPAILDTSS